MRNYPYVYTIGNLKRFLGTIPDVGTPQKITQEYLESMGFKSKNDRAIISVLKFVDLVQDDGRPAEDYKLLRDRSQSRAIMAAHVRKGYDELFTQFPDANLRSNDQLKNFFATKTDAGSAVLTLVSGTFKTLCDNADFTTTVPTILPASESGRAAVTATNRMQPTRLPGAGVTINLNIQLPATENAEVYKSIFKSLRENLIDPKPSTTN